MPGQLLSRQCHGWLGTAGAAGAALLECAKPCSAQKKFLGCAEGKQAVLAPFCWPLSPCLRLRSQVRDLQGNSPAQGCSRSPGWGDADPAFPWLRGAPQGGAWSLVLLGRMGLAHTSSSLTFPSQSLKGAVVPFAVGEAGQAGFVCVQLSQLPAAPPKNHLELSFSHVPEHWPVQTSAGPVSCLGSQSSPAARFTPQKFPHDILM